MRRESPDSPLPEKNQERVDEVGKWTEHEELRARWLLASEAAVLAWFGAPDAVYVDGGAERWEYRRIVSGVNRSLYVYLHRGRVTRMHP
jgi:hypothetical protein